MQSGVAIFYIMHGFHPIICSLLSDSDSAEGKPPLPISIISEKLTHTRIEYLNPVIADFLKS